MSTKLKAGTATSGAVIDADTSGNLDLVSGSSSQYTASLPLASGTVMVSGNQPAFSAYQSTTQSISANAYTKVQFQTEEYDTASAFDSTTNYRFTPLVAGYYQVNASVNAVNVILIGIYKNGSEYKRGTQTPTALGAQQQVVTTLVYLNGSTDYVECYAYIGGASAQNTTTGIATTYFNGSLVRTA